MANEPEPRCRFTLPPPCLPPFWQTDSTRSRSVTRQVIELKIVEDFFEVSDWYLSF